VHFIHFKPPSRHGPKKKAFLSELPILKAVTASQFFATLRGLLGAPVALSPPARILGVKRETFGEVNVPAAPVTPTPHGTIDRFVSQAS
jgi:hypothetical protein